MSTPLTRRLLDLPIRGKLACLLGLLVFNIAAMIGVGMFGMSTLSSLRAYVGGEGLWAKAQKNAIISLERYAMTRDEGDYRAFQDSLRVPLGDHRARLALERTPPDLDAADAGFVAGGNHPQDVRGVSLLFLRFHGFEHIRRAIGYWKEGDDTLFELQDHGERLRAAVRAGAPPAEIRRRLRAVDAINARLTILQDGFSFTLGEASRWAQRALFRVMLAGSLLLGALSLWVSLLIARAIDSGVSRLSDAATRASHGDLRARVSVDTADELGRLADDFNRMIDGLSKLDRMKNDFISTVSHELRTPLTLALAPLESLLSGRYGLLPPEHRKLVQTVHNNSVRLLQMVNGLLDFSRLEAGKVEARREPLDTAALTRAIVADFRPAAEAKGVTLALASLPAVATVWMDRYLYERVLFNLLSNAIKFTPRGGTVRVLLAADGDRLRLTVEDTGIGIAKEDQAQLFQKFRQVESSSTRRFEGTGLGLALVKEFVALLDGSVTLNSAPERGSAFTIDCLAPRAEPSDQPRELARTPLPIPVLNAEAPVATAAAGVEDAAAPRVLVAEDNPEMADYLVGLLRGLCRARVARDGAQALALAREWKPDLVLTDVMMPAKDGLSLCRELKADADFANVPVVLLTALTDRDSMMRGWEAGADEYLFKPFHPNEVMTRVRTLLSAVEARKRDARELARRAEELERSNADLEQFAFSASHDLQEPLRKISGFSRLLEKRGSALDADSRDMIHRMAGASERMQELVEGLLRFSRVAYKSEPPRPVDAREAFERAVANLEDALKDSGASLTCATLPRVMADPAQLAAVFQNLLSNAVKFRAPGRRPNVSVSAERRRDLWEFVVRDDGIGFDMRDHDRIFAIFERLHPRSRYPGSGIGLAACKKIVERHGGRIWAESVPGRGSAFRFTLPAA